MRLISDKLKSLLDIYNKAKKDFIRMIEKFVHWSKCCLLKRKIIAWEKWLIFQKRIDISQALKIKAIINAILCKSFNKFETINYYY